MSNFLILSNTLGDAATALDTTGTTISSPYDANDAISGPRNTIVLTDADSDTDRYSYTVGSNQSFDYVVIARADLIAASSTSRDIDFETYNGSSWSGIVSSGQQPFETSDLIGIDAFGLGYGQDYVESLGSQSAQGGRLEIENGSSKRSAFSKVYFCNSFDFGCEPTLDPKPTWEEIPAQDSAARPINGYFDYETEAESQLTFKWLSASTVESFYSLARVFEWPVFLYDPNAVLWDWKLEHVIIQSVKESSEKPDIIDLEIRFRRLKHYR